MAYFSFTAKRTLASGYSVDDDVGFYIDLVSNDPSSKAEKIRHISIGGKEVTRLHRIDYKNSILTVPVSGDKADLMDMFMDSVIAGETFSANLDTSSSSGGIDYKIDGDYSKKRWYGSYFQYQFKVREA